MTTNLIICSDLFFVSKVTGTAQALGFDCETVMSGAQAIERVQAIEKLGGVVIDLTTAGLNLPDVLAAIPTAALQQTIAFGPHVEREALQAAAEGGCAAVFVRSQLSDELPQILQQYLKLQ